MKRLSVQSLSSTSLGNQIISQDTKVQSFVEFNKIVRSLDFCEACAELDSVFINGKESRVKKKYKK